MLCSDGLTNMVDDSEIFNIVQQNKDNLDVAVQQLINKANECGGKDNIAIVLASDI